MPSITNVTLTIDSVEGDPNKQSVRVRGQLGFTPEEVGRSFRLSITLVGTDDPRAVYALPTSGCTSKPLYTFCFDQTAPSVPYKMITVTDLNTLPLDETRIIGGYSGKVTSTNVAMVDHSRL